MARHVLPVLVTTAGVKQASHQTVLALVLKMLSTQIGLATATVMTVRMFHQIMVTVVPREYQFISTATHSIVMVVTVTVAEVEIQLEHAVLAQTVQ